MMLENNNLAFVIATVLPALCYSIIVWSATPARTIKWKIAMLYFIMGTMSAWGISFFHWVFPMWDGELSSNLTVTAFLLAFFQVALLEESGKYAAFKLTDSYRHKRWLEHPAATMFYAMSVGAGFAIVENLLYVQRAQQEALVIAPLLGGAPVGQVWELVLVRSTTSMIVHMVCGILLGYFVACYRRESSTATTVSSWNPFLRKVWFNILGISAAAAFHGVYDFNLMVNPNASMHSVFAIVGAGMMIAYLLSKKVFKDE